jgi:afadin
VLIIVFIDIGYGNPRRMSERDIPSRISHEQEMQMRAHRNNVPQSQQQPRIQGSKSVPTLNDDNAVNSGNGQPGLQQRRNEPPPYSVGAQHPGYNSLTSSTSMPKSVSDFNSAQNLKLAIDNSNNFRNYAPQHSVTSYNAMNNYSPSRPESQMSLQSQQNNRMPSSASQQLYPEERHYQNIQLYQIQQQNPQIPTSKPSPNSMSSVPQTHRILHSSHSSLQADGQQFNPQQSSRPLSALISNREQEQYLNPLGPTPNTPTSPRPPISPHHSNMVSGQDHFHYPHNQQQQYPNPQMSSRQSSQDAHDSQNLLDYPSRNYPPPHPPFDPHSRQRDLMRQEAKMDEMREEIKRREERNQSAQQMINNLIRGPTPNGLWSQRPQYHPQQQLGLNGGSQLRMGPPPAPKPNRAMAPTAVSNYGQNSFIRQSSYREPHDNLPQQPNPPPPTVSYRYGPSGYPPSRQSDPLRSPNSNPQRTPFTNSMSNNRINFDKNNADMRKSNSGVVSPSPWEREEKERVIIFTICLYFTSIFISFFLNKNNFSNNFFSKQLKRIISTKLT